MCAGLASVSFPPCAHAETGSITIEQRANDAAVYGVYQVFTADISATDVATNIAWNQGNKEATLSFLDAHGYGVWLAAKGFSGTTAHDNAQNAAEFTALMIRGSAVAPNAGTAPETKASGSFAEDLAQSLVAGGTRSGTARAGSAYVDAEGYYLFVSESSAIGTGEAGSAPMWVPLGGSVASMRAKEFAPTLTFHVSDSGEADTWVKAIDLFKGEMVFAYAQGGIPDNVDAYDRFHDEYSFEFPAGIPLTPEIADSVTVNVGGRDVTAEVGVNSSGNLLTIEIEDVKALSGAPFAKGSTVSVTFRAPLGSGAQAGAPGNEIGLLRTYTNDPVRLTDGSSTRQRVSVYTYQGQLRKIDKGNGEALDGAEYTVRIQEGGSSEGGAQGEGLRYVQSDGTLASSPYAFITDEDGVFVIPGLDAGTYIVHETRAPSGYELADADMILTVSSAFDQATGSLSSLTASMTGGEAAGTPDGETSRVVSVDSQTGLVAVQAVDDRMVELANTGLAGNGILYAAAGGCAGVGAMGLAAWRRRDEAKPVSRRPFGSGMGKHPGLAGRPGRGR